MNFAFAIRIQREQCCVELGTEGATALSSISEERQPSRFRFVDEELKEVIQCGVCLEIPGLEQCRNGHILCQFCRVQLEACAFCRVKFDPELSINMLAARLGDDWGLHHINTAVLFHHSSLSRNGTDI